MTWHVAYPPDSTPLETPCGGSYDIDTMAMQFGDSGSAIPNNTGSDQWRVFRHERCHYLQHIGTSIGVFLGLLRHDRLTTCFENVKKLPGDVRQRLVRDRSSEDGRAIVPLLWNNENRAYRLGFDSADSERVDIFRQIAYDNWLVAWLLRDPRVGRRISHHRRGEEFIPLVIRDASLRAFRTFDVPGQWENLHRKNIPSLDVSEGYWVRYIPGRDNCGLFELFEGAAVANEIIFLSQSGANSGVIRQRFSTIVNGRYGVALRAYMDLLGIRDRNDLLAHGCRLLWPFLVVVDLALNPALPPFVVASPTTHKWADINPSHRFYKGLRNFRACDFSELESSEAARDHDLVSCLEDQLADACDFVRPSSLRFPDHRSQLVQADDFLSNSLVSTPADPEIITHFVENSYVSYDYLSALHRQAWAERSRDVTTLVVPGLWRGLPGTVFRNDRQEGEVAEESLASGLVSAPIVLDFTLRKALAGAGVDASHSLMMVYLAIVEQMIEDFFWRVGDFKLRGWFCRVDVGPIDRWRREHQWFERYVLD